ncbi:UNVERIFIED_CONTAM: hypothetical protein GTU68_060822, partial [Idotea baltica]|nr:hypothetical protein [Idotea baltica]
GSAFVVIAGEKTVGPRILDPSRGAGQPGIRAHNERLVLSLIRRHGSLSKAEIARRSRLSPQTVSVIMRVLEKDGLLKRGAPVRGKVGQPSIPMALNSDGVFTIGLKIGRRGADLILADFVGRVRKRLTVSYPYPLPDALMSFVEAGLAELFLECGSDHEDRIVGIGVAAPFELWNWLDQVGAPMDEMEAWRDFDFSAEIARFSDLPVTVENDATAACCAEHVFGRGREFTDYVYFFVGYFIGGGIVLNHTLHTGRTGNAGALGSMPIRDDDGSERQLIDCASIVVLERILTGVTVIPEGSLSGTEVWSGFDRQLDDWIKQTARYLTSAAVSACSVFDFEAVMIDGGFPSDVRSRLVEATHLQMQKIDTRGIERPKVVEASIGREARAVGAASLPLLSRYLLEQSAHV